MDTKPSPVFVFGSNLRGIHGAGAARFAVMNHGALYYQGVGRQGNSYAIPTKDYSINSLPLHVIEGYVKDFIRYAKQQKKEDFLVTAIGTGLAGYRHEDIGPMFKDAPKNCILPEEWKEITSWTFRTHKF